MRASRTFTSGEGVCVIDLDTVMTGVSLYDFGDLARSSLSAAPGDARDLSAVVVEMPVFEAIVRGFLQGAGEGTTWTAAAVNSNWSGR